MINPNIIQKLLSKSFLLPEFNFKDNEFKSIKFEENKEAPLFSGTEIQSIKLILDSRFTLYFENDSIARDINSIVPKANKSSSHWCIYLIEETLMTRDKSLCDFMTIQKYHEDKTILDLVKIFINQIIIKNPRLDYLKYLITDL